MGEGGRALRLPILVVVMVVRLLPKEPLVGEVVVAVVVGSMAGGRQGNSTCLLLHPQVFTSCACLLS